MEHTLINTAEKKRQKLLAKLMICGIQKIKGHSISQLTLTELQREYKRIQKTHPHSGLSSIRLG